MVKSFLIIIALLKPALTLAQLHGTQPISSAACGCPIPRDDADTSPSLMPTPKHSDHDQKLSHDGKYLFYRDKETPYVLNLETLESKLIAGDGYNAVWCPYDDVIAFNSDAILHPSRNGLFTYDALTNEIKDVTPASAKNGGCTLSPSGNGWTRGSRPGFDTFYVRITFADSVFVGFYSPQSLTFIPFQYPYHPGRSQLAVSNDSGHVVTVQYDTIPPYQRSWIYLDGNELRLPRSGSSISKASFSPNGKLLALDVGPRSDVQKADSTWPVGDTLFEQVWVYDVYHPTSDSVRIINFQCSFCMYSWEGINPAFLTDSTLAVSMAPDSAEFSTSSPWTIPLWEVTLDGRIVRKLTRLSTSSVVATSPFDSPEFKIAPNPARNHITLKLDTPSSYEVWDVLGNIRMQGKSAELSVSIDVTQLPAGPYLLRASNGMTAKTAKFLKE